MTAPLRCPPEMGSGWLGALDLEDVHVLDEPRWYPEALRWAFAVDITCSAPSTSIPPRSRWYVVLEASYPRGSVEVYPAVDGGVVNTFPHQRHNGRAPRGRPWRSGALCLTAQWTVDARPGRPPRDPELRLRWFLERAVEWTRRAASGTLLAPGDPFELPDFTVRAAPEFGAIVAPGLVDPAPWLEGFTLSHGLAAFETVQPGSAADRVTLVRSLHGRDTPAWGTYLTGLAGTRHHGAWLHMPRAPILRPWRAPGTWGELRVWASRQGLDLDGALAELCGPLRGRSSSVLILSFPVPTRVGWPLERLAWQAVRLPRLRSRAQLRSHRRDLATMDRATAFADDAPLHWLPTELWSRERLEVRGVPGTGLRSRRVALIGAGALGARVAELLVRGGVDRFHILDGDTVEVGNLVRHSATLRDLGAAKSAALCHTLQAASPFARVTADHDGLSADPDVAAEQLGDADLIIDATADDDVLATLAALRGPERLWCSVSLGRLAERLFCFLATGPSFPAQTFNKAFAPWGADEGRRHPEPLPWAGAGCWSPVFPARLDDITGMAAEVLHELERWISAPGARPELRVHDRSGRAVAQTGAGDSSTHEYSSTVTTCSAPDHLRDPDDRRASSRDFIHTTS